MSRSADEIMSVLDQAQEKLGPEFDLRDLLWEVLEDTLNSVQVAAEYYLTQRFSDEIVDTVTSYVSYQYGDD